MPLDPDDIICPECREPQPTIDEEIDNLFHSYLGERDTYAEAIYDAEDFNLCCNQHKAECDCTPTIAADVVDDLEIEEVYDRDGGCPDCIWAASAACPPLRKLARTFALTGDRPGPMGAGVTRCESYRPCPD